MAKTVLVVEDNRSIRELIKFLLEKEGYFVQVATNGTDALKEAQQNPPDLIMMDVMMRDLDGFETCKNLKSSELTRLIPVILISARGQQQEKEEGLRAGAEAYMVKPFDPEYLLKIVNKYVQQE